MSESTKVTKSESERARSFMSVRRTFSRVGATSTFCFSFSNCRRSALPLKYCTERMFVLVSMIISGLSKWTFQWITNFVNYIINIQSYQNTNKITFNSNSFLFACFSIAFECCKCARMRFHCATVLVVLSICASKKERCWRCNASGRSQTALSLLHYNWNAHVAVAITKNLGSNSQVY